VALGGSIASVSDDFFAEAFHLLLVEVRAYLMQISRWAEVHYLQPAPSLKGQFGPKGALFSGWESRRHNPTYDWYVAFVSSL
jgi:allantoicase